MFIEKILKSNLYIKYKSSLTYIFFSGVSAVLEFVLGTVLILFLIDSVVVANTISTILCTVFHYIFTTKKSFNTEVSIKSMSVYVVTFFIGLAIQNGVLELIYNFCIGHMGEVLSFSFGKFISLVVSFCVMYYLRKYLYKFIKKEN